ncbi:HD domain-containing protein [[Eubacterium] cellulosolvens]
MKLNIPTKENQKLDQVLAKVRASKRLEGLLECSNITAIDRMGYSDHGPTHVAIVSNIALKLLRNLVAAGVETSIEKYYKMSKEDAEVVVVLASILHDIGHIVHRKDHTKFSIMVANSMLPELLSDVYDEHKSVIISSEVMHAIAAHDLEYLPLTLEAGIVCVADGLDMKEGRARIPFDAGKVDIHSVSALAIDDIEISSGDKPILIKIKMSNSSGIFQIDNLLKPKLKNSGLTDYVQILVEIEGEEKKILDKLEI